MAVVALSGGAAVLQALAGENGTSSTSLTEMCLDAVEHEQHVIANLDLPVPLCFVRQTWHFVDPAHSGQFSTAFDDVSVSADYR